MLQYSLKRSLSCLRSLEMRHIQALFLFILTAPYLYAWHGDVDKFSFSSDTIRLNSPAETAEAYIADTSSVVFNAYWRCTFRFDYAPSSSNYAKWYLMSDSENLTEKLNGYYIRIGHTNKNIALCRQSGSNSQVVAQGETNRINEPCTFTISALRSEAGVWQVYSQIEAEPDSTLEVEIQENTFDHATHCGFMFKYTSTRSHAFSAWGFSRTGVSFDYDAHPAGSVWLLSDIFTPDGSGENQLAYICYSLPESSTANVYIFNTNGVLVKRLANNAMLPPVGFITWDGKSERNLQMPPGIYVVLFEAFTSERVILRRKVPFVISLK